MWWMNACRSDVCRVDARRAALSVMVVGAEFVMDVFNAGSERRKKMDIR
jgi:hypothetical protein